ncbi:pre-rRNA-processing protein TSR1 [Histomonas meleagridis]|uniref:pre-rRNA-processing protein TSR1-like n=1 Tax=Histomonas meleagridis TaxID=135588 RepID=UPI00355A8B83|nr:pre-rRNA-processing protein TSR1 [Histomonas meleagridis]KAH0799215.1 pre-rRNA-processing protein TSR1-like [Histomonas meleagridis]
MVKNLVPGPLIKPEKGQKGRRFQAKDAQRQNKINAAKLSKFVGSKNGPPKVVGILPCSENADPIQLLNILNFQPEAPDQMFPSGILVGGQFQCKIAPLPIARSIDFLIDVGKVSDIIVLMFMKDEPLDEWGSMAISILKSIGLPQIIVTVCSPTGQPIPHADIVNYRNYIQQGLPDVERILPIVTVDDVAQFVRFLSVTTPVEISWKMNRPNMLIQKLTILDDGNISIEGYLRGAPLDVHQIVTIPYVGDFQIKEANGIIPNDQLRHPMIYQASEGDPVITEEIHPPQTVGFNQNIEVIQNDFANMNLEGNEYIQNEVYDLAEDEREAIPTEEGVFMRNPEDYQFPDEFDYDGTVILNQRLRRYRGLKSFQNSPWDPYESLPPQYAQIYEFSNFNRASENAVADQQKGDIPIGSYVNIILISNGDNEIFERIPPERIIAMYGLFRNETRLTVINASIKNNSGVPIRSKETLLIICGFRNLWIRPLFSEDTRADKHLFIRVLGSGESAVASFIAPAYMQGCPVTYFKEIDGMMCFVGTGSIKTVDTNRMIIKRITLTGNPYRTMGRTARVTLMFFNKDDVLWFRNIDLETKNKRRGHIVEPIGLKGHFKAEFEQITSPDDTVCMHLYKRVFPKMKTDPVSF